MTEQIKYIKFENHLLNMQRMLLYPVLERADCIIDSIIIDDALTVTFDTKKLKAYANKTKKMSSYNYTDILADQYARNILQLSTDLANTHSTI